MDISQVLLPALIYVIVFFLIERVSFKDSDKFKSKLIYAIGFSILVSLVSVMALFGENPPHIGVVIFQIAIALAISISYIIWQYSKK